MEQIKQQHTEKQIKSKCDESKLNPMSEKILREKGLLRPASEEEVVQRLTKPIGAVKKSVQDSIEKPTFKPNLITKKTPSRVQTQNSSINTPVTSKGYPETPSYYSEIDGMDSVDYYGENLTEDFMNELNLDDDDDVYYPERFDDEGYGYPPEDAYEVPVHNMSNVNQENGIYSRSQKWLDQKNSKIEMERRNREMQEKAELTFRPKIRYQNDLAIDTPPPLPDMSYDEYSRDQYEDHDIDGENMYDLEMNNSTNTQSSRYANTIPQPPPPPRNTNKVSAGSSSGSAGNSMAERQVEWAKKR